MLVVDSTWGFLLIKVQTNKRADSLTEVSKVISYLDISVQD